MSLPTSDQVNSALRHVYSATAAITGTLVVVGLSQGDATAIGSAIHHIGDGISSIMLGVSALVPIFAGLYAAWSASPWSKMTKLNKDPEIEKVVAVPGTELGKIADAIPGNKITTTP